MKKIIKVFAVAFAAVALFSCAKEIQVPEEDNTFIELNGSEQIVRFTAGPISRSVFGTYDEGNKKYPTLWTDSYCVAVSLNFATPKKSSTPVVGSGGTSSSFNVALTDDSSGDYTFYAISPFDQCVSASSANTNFQITVPTAQTPTTATPDETAQIIFGSYDAGSTFPTSSVAMNFSHLTSYGKISFSNLSLAVGESIVSVSLTTASTKWAGRFYYTVADHAPAIADFSESSASNTITIATDQESGIWFGCAPVDLRGENIDVVITTDQGTTYSKTITIPDKEKYKFEPGKVNQFTINMSGIVADGAVVYTLVDDVTDLTLGSEVIIVAKDYDYAISTTQNGNNRGRAGITKSTGTINSPGADVQVLTIANGNKAGTYALKAGSDYLYAISSQNYLRTKNTLANDGSWFISVTNEGVATIKSIGTSDTRIMKYNNGSSIFSCYTSGQSDVCIYKKNGTGSGAITPKEAESLSITGATTSYSVDDSFDFDGTVKVVFSDTSEETLTASDYTVDDSDVNMSVAGTYTVTVTYNDDPTIEASYEITVSAGVVAPPANTVLFSESFDSAADGTSALVYYSSTGTTGAYNSGTYGTITYTRSNNSNVQIENANSAGGSAKQIMINKNGGSLTISGIKTYGASHVRVSFKYICAKSSAPITATCGETNSGDFNSTSADVASFDATISGATFDLVIRKTSTANSSAARFDDITITVID